MKQTLENNKLIAEFMGMQDTDLGWYDSAEAMSEYACQMVGGNTFEELQYDRSWDWLMPVVEKIETTPTNSEPNTDSFFNVRIEPLECTIYGGDFESITRVGNTKLEATYIAVVEFIKQTLKQ